MHMSDGGVKPRSDRTGTRRRNPQRYNEITGLAERKPFAANVVRVLPRARIPLRLHVRIFYARWNVFERGRQHRLDEKGAALLGETAEKRVQKYFNKAARKKFERMKNADDMTYLLIRGLPTVTWLFPFPKLEEFPEKRRDAEFVRGLEYPAVNPDSKAYEVEATERQQGRQKKVNDLFRYADYVIAGLACMLECVIKKRYNSLGHPLARNMLTDPGEQQSSDLDNIDMALRFQQSTVEKELPEAGFAQSYADESCLYRIYLCVKNRWRVPIFLTSVYEILTTHLCPYDPSRRAWAIEQLQKDAFERRGPRTGEKATQQATFGPVLRRTAAQSGGSDDWHAWTMSFDHERVRAKANDVDAEEALRELREAIRRARRDAVRIVLKPGNVLIVDNLRAMTSRRELFPTSWMDWWRILLSLVRWAPWEESKANPGDWIKRIRWWPFKPHRWLRTYYAFRAD
jgi:hypothetical protein